MRGCRPLTIAESKAVFEAYSGRHRLRNQCLHMLCITTGLRVSEALSLRVGDVIKKGKVVRRVRIARANMKRKKSGRTVDLVAPARIAVERQLQWLLNHGHLSRDQYLFRSQAGDRPIRGARRIRKKSYAKVFRASVRAETSRLPVCGSAARRNRRLG